MEKYTEVKRAGGKLYSNNLELYRNEILKLYSLYKLKLYIYREKYTVLAQNCTVFLGVFQNCIVLISF